LSSLARPHKVRNPLLACSAGLLLCCCARGLDQYLTIGARWFEGLVAAFFLLVWLGTALEESALWRKQLASFAMGLLAGLALPNGPIDPPRGVVTASVGGRFAGDLFAALDRIDRDPASVLGTTLTVSGAWTPASGGQAATVSRRIMACCAADTIAVGFDVLAAQRTTPPAGSNVVVSGTLRAQMRNGEVRYELAHAAVRRLP